MSRDIAADHRLGTNEVLPIDRKRTGIPLDAFPITRESGQDEAQLIMDRLVRAYLERPLEF